jgi:SAM-dependent methyltransferase
MGEAKPPPYYDHEPVYRTILDSGGEGWDDRANAPSRVDDSYRGLDELIAGPWLAGRGPMDVLDVGSGGGQALIRLAPIARRLVGVDYAASAVELARRNIAHRGVSAELFAMDATSLDGLADASFDLVVDNHMLHCLVEPSDRAAYFAAARRVLRDGGIFFSETMSREGSIDLDGLSIDRETFVHASGKRYWTSAAGLTAELNAAGFVLVEMRRREQRDEPPAGDLLWTIARRALSRPSESIRGGGS